MTSEPKETLETSTASTDSTSTPVNLYTTPRDTRGAKTKAWFQAQGIPFTDHNVVADLEALKRMIEISGSRTVPVVQIGDRVLVGFDENQLAASLSENNGVPQPNGQRARRCGLKQA